MTLRKAKTLFQLELFRFRGFLGCLNLPGGQGLYRFATYTGAFIDKIDVSQDQGIVPRAGCSGMLFVQFRKVIIVATVMD